MLKEIYINSKLLNRKNINAYNSLLKKKAVEIKTSLKHIDEGKKQFTGIKYNDDIIFTTKYFTDDFKSSNLKISELFSMMKRNKHIDTNLLEGLTIHNSNYRPVDTVLYNISMLKYNLNNGYFTKASHNIKNSLEILRENNFSENDNLASILRLEKSYIEAHSTESYSSLKNNIFNEIANGYILEDPAIVVTGYLYLIKFFYYFNFFSEIPALLYLTFDQSKNHSIKNTFVNDHLIKSMILNQYQKKKVKHLISTHSEPAMMNALVKLRSKIEVNNGENNKYFSLSEELNKTIKFFEDNFPDDPSLYQFYVKKWVVENQVGREATSSHFLEKSRSVIAQQFSGAESYVNQEFLRDTLFECMCYQNYSLGNDFSKKNVKIINKNNYLNLIFKSLNLQFQAAAQSPPNEIVEKMDDFCRSHDKFFGGENAENNTFKQHILNMVKSSGYRTVVENFEDKSKGKKMKSLE